MSASSRHRPLLVTGAHRSGTGWVAQVLAASPTPLGYVWEPWSPGHRPGTFPVRFPRYFQYVCAENAGDLAPAVRDLLALHYRPFAELKSLRSPKDAARMARDWARFTRERRRGAAALLKDPIALFSSEWLADTFELDVVALIRHPAAFAATIKRRKWRHDFQSFLDQPLLMRDFLAPYKEQIRFHATATRDIVDEAILLWNVLYAAVAQFQESRPDWVFVRLEDLSREPLPQFRALYERLALQWSREVEELVAATSSSSNPTIESHGGSIRRNSEAHSWSWQDQLSAAEIDRIRRGTEAVAAGFYADADWHRAELPVRA